MSIFGQSADGKGRTMWQWIRGTNKALTLRDEFDALNVLGAKPGQIVVASSGGLNGDFVAGPVAVWKGEVLGTSWSYADYRLHGWGRNLTLRAIPNPDSTNEHGCDFVVLEDLFEMTFEEAEESGLLDDLDEDEFVVYEDKDELPYREGEEPTFWRVGDVRGAYDCRKLRLDAAKEEIHADRFRLWDYWRNSVDVVTLVETTEYLFIDEELQDDVHYFTAKTGTVIDPIKITVI